MSRRSTSSAHEGGRRVHPALARPAADGWRRSLALMLDGLRPEAATPLPVPPLTYEEIERALAATDSASA
jgi:hypothetical protein